MKLVLLSSALVAIVAGTASASLFLEAPSRNPAPTAPAVVSSPPEPAAIPRPTPRALFETRQDPVPSLRVTARPTVVRKAAGTEGSEARNAASVGEAEARAAILADGYRSVRVLTRLGDGRWTARALRGSTEIAVTVDAEARVSAN
jgi:hypothetical protein